MISNINSSNTIWRILYGMSLLAIGRREGITYFSGTVEAFYASLAPWLAFLLVDSLQIFFQPHKSIIVIKLLLSFCVLLLPPVISQVYAYKWGCMSFWLRYITAAMWCNWVMVIVPLVSVIFVLSLLPTLVTQSAFMKITFMGVALYSVWIQWFVARIGLSVSGLRAAVLYATVLLANCALYGIIILLSPHIGLTDFLPPIKIGGK